MPGRKAAPSFPFEFLAFRSKLRYSPMSPTGGALMMTTYSDMSHPAEAQITPVLTLLVACGGRAPYWVANAFAGASER
jgi:hypothetical protein